MKKGRTKRNVIMLCTLIVLVVLVIWTAWGNTALMVNSIVVLSTRLPAGFFGYRIAHISDLHNSEFGAGNTMLLQMISESAPDIIVITGDLVDMNHTNIDIALDFAESAVLIAPVYCVTGNHEASLSQYNELKAGLESAGVVVLEDETILLEHNGSTLTLIGLSDPNFTINHDVFEEVPAMVSAKLDELIDHENAYTILLSHRPELFETYVNCGVDLVLSGHAHGGQFRLPFIGGLVAPNQGLFPKYDAGLYTDGDTDMIVSRGIGNSIIPVRFNNRPEVVLVELKA